MVHRSLGFMVLLLVFSSLCACHKQDGPQDQGATSERPLVKMASLLLSQPLDIARYEVDVQALPDLLAHRGQTLVLLAQEPFLAPVPTVQRGDLTVALRQDGSELQRRLGRVADPLLLPGMLIRAVLDEGIFSRIIWVVPSTNPQEQIDLGKFTTLIKSFDLSGVESFRRAENGTLTGELGRVRFDVVHPAALPALSEPAVVHLDLGFFAAIYKNEIKTPLVPLVREILVSLRNAKWTTSAVTFSYSNHSGQVGLSLRPLGVILQRLFAEPQLLDATAMPENWLLLGKTLYLESFFQNEEILRLLVRMEANEPQAAWVKYLHSNFSRRMRDAVAADHYLAAAIKRDPGYALEYMELAGAALQEGNTGQVLANLRNLVAALPDDPLFRLSLCEELVEQKQFAEVRILLPELRKLPWSPIYYSNVRPTLENFQRLADQ